MALTQFLSFPAPACTQIYTLSLHDALPIYGRPSSGLGPHISMPLCKNVAVHHSNVFAQRHANVRRSEEHTSELQSRVDLVCRLLLEKKKTTARKSVTASTKDCHMQ